MILDLGPIEYRDRTYIGLSGASGILDSCRSGVELDRESREGWKAPN